MRGVNRVMLIGNLGKDPDVQILEGNIAVAKFPLATTETFKDRTGKLVSQTEWHTVVLWRGLAELAQKYLHKSSLIYIEGRLRTRSWEDKDGHRSYILIECQFTRCTKCSRASGRSFFSPSRWSVYRNTTTRSVADTSCRSRIGPPRK